jgi:two-component system, sensor histidine kinase PdtaS
LGLAPVLIFIWTLLRIAILGEHPGWPYEMFVPTIVISSLWLGPGSGYITAVLSSVVAAWAFVPPAFSFVTLDDPVELAGFCISLTINVSIVWMIDRLTHLAAKDKINTAKLTDSVRHLNDAHSQNITLSNEFEHRIRNDLQRLLGTVTLQAKRTKASDNAQEALFSVQRRIESMLSLHARLGALKRTSGKSSVNTRDFLTGIVEDLSQTVELRPIHIRMEIESHIVSMDQAKLLGIIANEAVTNALKYAFPDDRSGWILVRFHQDGDKFILAIEDNGIGIASGTSSVGTGLGSSIIRSIAAQLGGTACLGKSNTGGTVFEVEIPSNSI